MRPAMVGDQAAFQVSVKPAPFAVRVLGTASMVEPLTISIAAAEYPLIVPGAAAVADAPVKVTLPKLASEVSEQLRLQTSGRSTTHSAEDWAAEKAMRGVE